jgi:hypothetical protein
LSAFTPKGDRTGRRQIEVSLKSGGIGQARQPLPAPLVLGFDRLPRQRFFDHEADLAPV